MNRLTAYEFSTKLTFCYNRLRSLLSDIDFGELTVSADTSHKLEEMHNQCSLLLRKYESLLSQSSVNLTAEEQIIYKDILNTVSEYEKV